MPANVKREFAWVVIVAVLLAAVILLVLLDLWGLSLFGSAVDYNRFGNWSDAVSGIGTLSAVVLAVVSILVDRLRHREELQRELDSSESSVFLWLSSVVEVDDNDRPVGRSWVLKIQNTTTSPVYEWRVTFEGRQDHLCAAATRPVLPGENIFNLEFLDDIEPKAIPRPALVFKGRFGNVWRRTELGDVSKSEQSGLECAHTRH